MDLTKELTIKIIEKTQKILSRPVYFYDRNGIFLNNDPEEVDFRAIEAIRQEKDVIEKKAGKFFHYKPIIYNKRVVGAIATADFKKEKASEFSKLASGMIEVFLYEEFLVKNIYVANDLRSEFLKEILIGSSIKTTEEAVEQGDIVGVNLRAKHAIIILKIDNLYEQYLQENEILTSDESRVKFQGYLEEIEDYIHEGFKDKSHNSVIYVGSGEFIILKHIKKEDINTLSSVQILKGRAKMIFNFLNGKFPDRVSISVGQYYPGLAGLKKSFEDASIAMKLGEKVFGRHKIYHVLDVGMFVGLLDNVTTVRKSELAFQILKDLFTDPDLLKTTKAFLDAGMNLTEAAKKLHLHRNTLIYRLDKVKQLIKLDPRIFHDAIQIKLGLTICSSQEAELQVN